MGQGPGSVSPGYLLNYSFRHHQSFISVTKPWYLIVEVAEATDLCY